MNPLFQPKPSPTEVVVGEKTVHRYIDIYKHGVKMQQVKDAEIVVIDGKQCYQVSPDCIDYYPIPYPIPTRSTYQPVGRSIDNVICYLRFSG